MISTLERFISILAAVALIATIVSGAVRFATNLIADNSGPVPEVAVPAAQVLELPVLRNEVSASTVREPRIVEVVEVVEIPEAVETLAVPEPTVPSSHLTANPHPMPPVAESRGVTGAVKDAVSYVAGGAWDATSYVAGGAWDAVSYVAGGAWDAASYVAGGASSAANSLRKQVWRDEELAGEQFALLVTGHRAAMHILLYDKDPSDQKRDVARIFVDAGKQVAEANEFHTDTGHLKAYFHLLDQALKYEVSDLTRQAAISWLPVGEGLLEEIAVELGITEWPSLY